MGSKQGDILVNGEVISSLILTSLIDLQLDDSTKLLEILTGVFLGNHQFTLEPEFARFFRR